MYNHSPKKSQKIYFYNQSQKIGDNESLIILSNGQRFIRLASLSTTEAAGWSEQPNDDGVCQVLRVL
jgi:hypothetical protein